MAEVRGWEQPSQSQNNVTSDKGRVTFLVVPGLCRSKTSDKGSVTFLVVPGLCRSKTSDKGG